MNRDTIAATIQGIVRDVLDNETLALSDQMTAADVDNWDSLSHISIITAIEQHYGIRFTLGELDSFHEIGDLITMVDRKLAR